MIIVKEASKNKSVMKEALMFADVIGLTGFAGYTITRPKMYSENFDISRGSELIRGAGDISVDDVVLISKGKSTISFPAKEVKAIGMVGRKIRFLLADNTIVEFIRV